jgi:transcription elongation GreA/GreB family factor
MNDKEKIEFKNKLKLCAIEVLEKRIEASSSAMSAAQAAANDEGRSSVGDKHQTGRAMAHIDVEIHARQLDTAQKDLAFIQKVDVSVLNDKIDLGTFAETSEGKYFFLSGLGVNDFNNEKIFYLSISSPVGKMLKGKGAGEKITFNEKDVHVLNVF